MPMNSTLRMICTALLALTTALSGCDRQPENSASVQIDRPALPIIQDAVLSLSPLFDGRRDPVLMEQVCALATGETHLEAVEQVLRQHGLDPARLPRQDSPLALLVNGDEAAQQTACAAFLATSVLQPVEVNEFLQLVGADSPASIDPQRLNQVLPIKLAEARSNAEIFSLIAGELAQKPGLSMPAYRQAATQAFKRLAPLYLQRVRRHLPPAGTTYRLTELTAHRFAFSAAPETRFTYTDDGLQLYEHGVQWYGAGQLLGRDYRLQVSLLAAAPHRAALFAAWRKQP